MAKVTVDRRKCKGCLLCVHVCPKGILVVGATLNEKGLKTVEVKNGHLCLGCGQCALMCPECGIEIHP